MHVNYMEEAGENRGKEHFPTQVNGFSGDLLRKFMNGNGFLPGKYEGKVHGENDNGRVEDEEEEVNLSLGLSLNGNFGVDPKRAQVKLMRSSSVSIFMFSAEENHARVVPIAEYEQLTRTSSLPTEKEEEWRKRKALQSLRRMEAKRRRMDKLKFLRVGKDKVDSEENGCEENGSNSNSNGQVLVSGNGKGMPLSQGSIGSQGSGSSGLSDFESQPLQVNKNNEVRSPSSNQSQPHHNEQKPTVGPGTAIDEGAKESKDMLRNVMLHMPCVSTIGDGPNGKKIEGFLYRYRKGEEVRIVCVCHGSFLSPAEFVKHAGGGDVEHPLRHIVINPSPFL